MNKNVIEALPKTYHHPIGPSMALGTGWRIIGSSVSLKLRRRSNHRQTDARSFLDRAIKRVLQGWIVRRLHFELALAQTPLAAKQAPWGRPRGTLAVGI